MVSVHPVCVVIQPETVRTAFAISGAPRFGGITTKSRRVVFVGYMIAELLSHIELPTQCFPLVTGKASTYFLRSRLRRLEKRRLWRRPRPRFPFAFAPCPALPVAEAHIQLDWSWGPAPPSGAVFRAL